MRQNYYNFLVNLKVNDIFIAEYKNSYKIYTRPPEMYIVYM